jgi:hypothetical protein
MPPRNNDFLSRELTPSTYSILSPVYAVASDIASLRSVRDFRLSMKIFWNHNNVSHSILTAPMEKPYPEDPVRYNVEYIVI